MKLFFLRRSVAITFGLLAHIGLSQAQGSLENPAEGSVESGVSVISGWHCDANTIEIFIDGRSIGNVGSGTSRADTKNTCGREDTGFSLLLNYGVLSEGTHRMTAIADGELWQEREFSVVRPGGENVEFARDLEKTEFVFDFPEKGQVLELEWVQSKQSFVAKQHYRNLVQPTVTIDIFNREFKGVARGFNVATGRGIGEVDNTVFNFDVSETEFTMSRSGTLYGSCEYTGSVDFGFNQVDSEGRFTCGDVVGEFTAKVNVYPNDGLYIGEFTMKLDGSNFEITDFHTALAP